MWLAGCLRLQKALMVGGKSLVERTESALFLSVRFYERCICVSETILITPIQSSRGHAQRIT